MSTTTSINSTHKDSNTIRWGILSTANISLKFINAVRRLGPAEAVIVAVGSRSLETAQCWAKAHGITKGYGSYEEVLDDPEIDAVYIPLPTHLHAQFTVLAADKKKHVLCEKPLGRTVEEVKQMIEACERNGVQLMDGVMWSHHLRTKEMRERFSELGDIKRVTSCFSILDLPEGNIRFNKNFEPLGCLGDLGWYNVRACLFAFGEECLPERVWGTATLSDKGVMVDCTGVLWYSNGRMATFDCSFNTVKFRQWLEISGTEKSLYCDDFILPWNACPHNFPQNETYDEKSTFTICDNRPGVKTLIEVEKCLQEAQLVRDFNTIVKKKQLDKKWPSLALNNQIIVNALAESIYTGKKVKIN